jgi:GT2 family glycosyltransferase
MPNMNNVLVLDDVLEKLRRHTTYPNFELIVADDGSTDGSLPLLRRWRDSGRFAHFVLLEREHAGIVPTLNAGLDAVHGELVVRVDGDTTVETPGWLERMLEFHLSHERIGVTVGRIVIDTGHVHAYGISVIGPQGLHDRGTQPLEPIGERSAEAEVMRPLDRDCPLGDQLAEVDSALGAWTMFSAELARAVGGWDPAYNPVWYEDIDFALGARRLGRKVFYFPGVRVVHHLSRRDPRLESSVAKLLLIRANRRIGRLVPGVIRARLAAMARVGESDPGKRAIIERHRAHWQRKWGFDPLNPDMAEVSARYRGTELLWAYEDDRRRAGEQIVAAYQPRGEHGAPGHAAHGRL